MVMYKKSCRPLQEERKSVARLEEHGVLDSLVALLKLVASNILEEEEVPKLHTDRDLEHSSLKIVGRI
jgi:hypothetical protein